MEQTLRRRVDAPHEEYDERTVEEHEVGDPRDSQCPGRKWYDFIPAFVVFRAILIVLGLFPFSTLALPEWMMDGSINEFVEKYPGVDRPGS